MTQMETATLALDKLQVAALRKADRVSFHRNADGETMVIATKINKPSPVDPFAPREVDYRIPADDRLTDYRKPDSAASGIPATRQPGDVWRAFAWVYYTAQSANWQTAAHMLREGDTLRLHWTASGGDTDTIRNAGLAVDYFDFEIIRNGKVLAFRLDSYAGEAHSSARMVR